MTVLLLLLLSQAAASPAPDLRAAILRCSQVEENARRLACFDRVAGELKAPADAGADLQVLDFIFREMAGGRMLQAEGRVSNISTRPLENVQAIVSFFGPDGSLVATAKGPLDFNPLMPGAAGTFSVVSPHSGGVADATVEFGVLLGPKLKTERAP